jgi:hypothetical protein
MFPQALPTVDDQSVEEFTGPIEVDMSESRLSTTLSRGDNMQLARGRRQGPGAEPVVEYWFDKSFIDTERQVWLFYVRPHRDMVESLLQFQFGSSPVVRRFNVDPDPGRSESAFEVRPAPLRLSGERRRTPAGSRRKPSPNFRPAQEQRTGRGSGCSITRHPRSPRRWSFVALLPSGRKKIAVRT